MKALIRRSIAPVAVVAISASLTLAATGVASAAAKEFSDTIPGGFTISAVDIQTFRTVCGTVECTALKGAGTWSAKTQTQSTEVNYEKCNGFGIKVAVSVADYTLHDEAKSVDVTNTINITAKEGGAAVCDVVVKPQSGLETLNYVNLAGDEIEIQAKVTGIESEGSGSLSTCKYAKEDAGFYDGDSKMKSTNDGELKA